MKWFKSLLGRVSARDQNTNAESAAADTRQAAAAPAAEGSLSVSSDVPIRDPSQDAYGIDGFAKALAKSIANANAADGLVFAINGPWGSGKSSACNLVLHHLQPQVEAKAIVPITFNPWWFSGAEALTASFFQELSVPIGKSVSKRAKEMVASLGQRVSSVGLLLETLGTALGLPGAGSIVSAGAEAASKLKSDQTVEEEHEKLADALRTQSKKFLVVIDDIDRLGTDEALQMFRLVKSVGRLPNVIYLLAFDRPLAEKMIAARFPAEGSAYLDKFIQGGFDLPLPDAHDLRQSVLRVVQDVMGDPPDDRMTRFWNLFYDVCAPLIRIPRDAIRLNNAIRVTWPAIGADVDRADFLALETLRLFIPGLHRAIRANSVMLLGSSERDRQEREQQTAAYDRVFLECLDERDRKIAKRALIRLFPKTEYAWSNVMHTDTASWRRDRLACSPQNFPTYFAFSVNEETVTASEITEMLRLSANANDVAQFLRTAAATRRRRGGSRAALVLEELQVQVDNIVDQNVESLLTGLFSVADEIDLEADRAGGGDIGDNHLRIHWLLNNVIRDRFAQSRRGQILEIACASASLAWLVDISRRCTREHIPTNQERSEQREPLVERAVAVRIAGMAVNRVSEAAGNGTLMGSRRLIALLFDWMELSAAAEVRQWTDERLAEDAFVILLADKTVQSSWISAVGDRVARRREYADLSPYNEILDVVRFRARIAELLGRPNLSQEGRTILERFTAAPGRARD